MDNKLEKLKQAIIDLQYMVYKAKAEAKTATGDELTYLFRLTLGFEDGYRYNLDKVEHDLYELMNYIHEEDDNANRNN